MVLHLAVVLVDRRRRSSSLLELLDARQVVAEEDPRADMRLLWSLRWFSWAPVVALLLGQRFWE